MRLFYFLFLVAFTGAAGLLAYENRQEITLTVFNQTFTVMVAALVGLAYLAGMLSGWTLIGILRRSFNRVTSEPWPGERRGRLGYSV